jgi:hypothetical protein
MRRTILLHTDSKLSSEVPARRDQWLPVVAITPTGKTQINLQD